MKNLLIFKIFAQLDYEMWSIHNFSIQNKLQFSDRVIIVITFHHFKSLVCLKIEIDNDFYKVINARNK